MKRIALLVAVVLASLLAVTNSASAQAPPPTTMNEWRAKWMNADNVIILPRNVQPDISVRECKYDLRQVHLAGVTASDAGQALTLLRWFGFIRRTWAP